jgi:hypothetical protein
LSLRGFEKMLMKLIRKYFRFREVLEKVKKHEKI